MNRPLLLAAILSAFTACGGSPEPAAPASPPPPAPEPAPPVVVLAPADAFLAAFKSYCGKAYAGRIVANEPPPSPENADPFDGKSLVMHVRECSEDEVKIPFHVGDDHSRTWILTRTAGGVRLKHDHRHADGSSDAVTMYGGDTVAPGSAARQEFPADAESIALFEKNALQASIANTWAMEIEPDRRIVYELGRPGRLFRVEFDLTRPVETPPAPWGAEGD